MPVAAGSAATRIELKRFMGPSAETDDDGRMAPVQTTGLALFTVRCRKKAVSSRVSVPWVTTTPSQGSGPSSSAVIRRDISSHRGTVIDPEEMLLNCSTRTSAISCTPGIISRSCSPVKPIEYPLTRVGEPARLAIVPPVASTTIRGRSLWAPAPAGRARPQMSVPRTSELMREQGVPRTIAGTSCLRAQAPGKKIPAHHTLPPELRK